MLTEAQYGRIRTGALRSIATETVRDPPGDDDTVMLGAAVSDWLGANFEDRLAEFDPERVSRVIPVDPDTVEAGATTPMREQDGEDRQRLHAYRAVRTDLLEELSGVSDRLATAIAVHDALELLVGARGDPTDRRPADLVESFVDWVADRTDDRTARRARESFTVLHVMRIAVVDVLEGDDLGAALADWLEAEHPGVYDERTTTVER